MIIMTISAKAYTIKKKKKIRRNQKNSFATDSTVRGYMYT